MKKKYLIIYHDADNDGLVSMAIIYNYLVHELKADEEEIELLGAEYEKLKTVDIDDMISSYEHILLTDVSFQEFHKIKKIYKAKKNNFCWIDHHAPIIRQSISEGYSDIVGVRDTHRSALLNAYKHFYDPFDIKYNNKDITIEMFRILSAMDSFTFEQEGYSLDYVRAVNTGIDHKFNLEPEIIINFVYSILYNVSEDFHNNLIKEFYDFGLMFNKVEQAQYDSLVKNYGQEFFINADGRKVIALFTQGPTSSLMFSSIKDEYTNGLVFKHLKYGNWSMSLYNTDIKYDKEFHCGEYLKEHYNGGGHAGAAGCQISEEQFIEILKSKTI